MEELLLGTYTKNESKGIYKIIFDDTCDSLTDLELVSDEKNPTYLALDDNHHLFSVSKYHEKGGIASFNRGEIPYTLVNRVLDDTAPLCYVSVDSERQLAFGTNYHDGSLYSYKIADDGELTLVEKIKREGHSIHPNQQSSHMHYANLTPDKRLIACDLGTDEIILYNISNTGHLEELTTFKFPEGAGPRHLIFSPINDDILYVICELDNKVYTLKYNNLTPSFELLNSTSALETPTNETGSSAIKISKDGKYLYVSTRSDNSISVFEISNNGTDLKLIQHIATKGNGPRDFALTLKDEYLVVGHQNTNNLTLFKRNKENGKLTLISSDTYAPEVVCIISAEN